MAQKDDMLVAARPVSRDVAAPMTDTDMMSADALEPTPTECAQPRRFSDFATVGEALDYAASGSRGLNFHDPRGKLVRPYPYSELKADALRAAYRLIAAGVRPNDRIALIAETGAEFAALFFGTIYAGAWPVPLPLPTSFGGRDSYVGQLVVQLTSCDPKMLFFPPEIAAMATEAAEQRQVLPLDWSAGGSNDGPLIVGTSNADAVRYLRHVATWPVRTAVLTGPRGSGRSLMGRLFARETGGRVIDGQDSVSEEEIFHAWNAAQTSGVPLLIVADAPPAEWNIALPDLRSRLAAVPVLTIAEPDDCLARDLIDALFAQRGIVLAPGVASYIVPRMERSYAMIHRVVAALDAASLEKGGGIGIRLTRETLLSQGLIDPDLLERQDEATCR